MSDPDLDKLEREIEQDYIPRGMVVLRKADARALLRRVRELEAERERAKQAEAQRDELRRELEHLVFLMEPVEYGGGLNIPGLATLNGARNALAASAPVVEAEEETR